MGGGTHEPATRDLPEAAYEAAFLALMDSLACAFKALQDPACTRLLGALVPGATMAFGARVPGTSYQLDPVHAAFNIGTMVGWLDGGDEALASNCGRLADNLGAVLAVADYRSRKALAEGEKPLTVREVLAVLVAAHEQAGHEWGRWNRGSAAAAPGREPAAKAAVSARCGLTRIASAAAVVSLLGGTDEQRATAIVLARSESGPIGSATDIPPGRNEHQRWQLGDATARGVRLALIALADRTPPCPAVEPSHPASGIDAAPDRIPVADPVPDVATRIHDRFAAGVAAHFPPAQGTRLVALFADRCKLEALPINELVSMTVRN
jgi:2-methylcitrate dehydratase PrpD